MIIYVDQITTRLIYTLDFVFKERGLSYTLCDDFIAFETIKDHKFNYSGRYFEGVKSIEPTSLLFDEDLKVFGLTEGVFQKEPCIAFNGNSDPLAGIFYVLSRMEEYGDVSRDNHLRFEGKNSVLFRFNWHEKAVCDRWAHALLSFLEIEINTPIGIDNFLPTFDIDSAYAYRYKGIIRNSLSSFKDFIYGRRKELMLRQKVQSGFKKDPFDTYDIIEATQDKGFQVLLFWLLGDYGKYDKNLSYKHPKHKKLIKRISERIEIGIHPSYKSNSYYFYLHQEIERLEGIVNKRVHKSRQHYLKLQFPLSYQTLIDQEITDDYTMGYADIAGFRAGTARSFLWFDLSKNEITTLRVHPFAYMDGTLNEYLHLSPEDAKNKIKQLHEEVNQYGGDFIFIWHNETLGDKRKWKGWLEVFYYTLNLKNK